MLWLNLPTSTRTAPAFVGADPQHRATWLCLMLFCAEHETGGLIPNCRDWGDRRWMQTAGVLKGELNGETDLWKWEGDSLRVWGYPAEKERVVRDKREYGRKGGKASGEARKVPTGEAPSEAESKHMLHHMVKHKVERNGMEWNGMEETPIIPLGKGDLFSVDQSEPVAPEPKPARKPKAKPDQPDMPAVLSLSPEFVAAWDRWTAHRRELRKPLTPTATRQQFAELERMGPEDAVAAIDQSIRNGWTGIFAPKVPRPNQTDGAPNKPATETVWQIRQRLDATESAIREIEGRSPGPHCQLSDFLRPGEAEKLTDLRKRRKQLRDQLATADGANG
jgi:hypothetical protein